MTIELNFGKVMKTEMLLFIESLYKKIVYKLCFVLLLMSCIRGIL